MYRFMPLRDGDELLLETLDCVNKPLPHPGVFTLLQFAVLQANLQATIRASAEEDAPPTPDAEDLVQPRIASVDGHHWLGHVEAEIQEGKDAGSGDGLGHDSR